MDIPIPWNNIEKCGKDSSINSVYDSRHPDKFVKEIGDYLKFPINGWLSYDENSLSRTVDLLEGIHIFIPDPVMNSETMKDVSLPGGAVVLDGDKVNQYLSYSLAADTYSEEISRSRDAGESARPLGRNRIMINKMRYPTEQGKPQQFQPSDPGIF